MTETYLGDSPSDQTRSPGIGKEAVDIANSFHTALTFVAQTHISIDALKIVIAMAKGIGNGRINDEMQSNETLYRYPRHIQMCSDSKLTRLACVVSDSKAPTYVQLVPSCFRPLLCQYARDRVGMHILLSSIDFPS